MRGQRRIVWLQRGGSAGVSPERDMDKTHRRGRQSGGRGCSSVKHRGGKSSSAKHWHSIVVVQPASRLALPGHTNTVRSRAKRRPPFICHARRVPGTVDKCPSSARATSARLAARSAPAAPQHSTDGGGTLSCSLPVGTGTGGLLWVVWVGGQRGLQINHQAKPRRTGDRPAGWADSAAPGGGTHARPKPVERSGQRMAC